MSDLLPCPHCGGEAYIRRTIVNDDIMFVVFCEDSEDCGASVSYFPERKQAIAAWNQRNYTTVELDETQGFAVTGLEPNAEGELHD